MERGPLGLYRRYQGSSPQPPGAKELVADTLLGVKVRKSILGHSTLSQVSSTKPPVSPELAFQHLRNKHCAVREPSQAMCSACCAPTMSQDSPAATLRHFT